MSSTHPLIEALDARVERWTQTRRDLHAHPELAFEENRTAEVVARTLRAAVCAAVVQPGCPCGPRCPTG